MTGLVAELLDVDPKYAGALALQHTVPLVNQTSTRCGLPTGVLADPRPVPWSCRICYHAGWATYAGVVVRCPQCGGYGRAPLVYQLRRCPECFPAP